MVIKRINKGFAFHVHHDKLVEWCTDFEERVSYIKSQKPRSERVLRLRLLKIIPEDRLPTRLLTAQIALDKARAELAYNKTKKVAYNRAYDVYDRALAKHMPDLITLHAELCPNCPWDGETIFKKKAK